VVVSDVKVVKRPGIVPRICATFTEIGGNYQRPRIIHWLNSETGHCEEGATPAWEPVLTRILQQITEGGLTVRLDRDEKILVVNTVDGTMTPGVGERGQRVHIGGKHLEVLRMHQIPNTRARVCLRFEN
jgi:hypothetical protein